jgi:hypothetical protein
LAIGCRDGGEEDRAGDKTMPAQFYGRALTIYRDMSASDPSNVGIRSDLRRRRLR